MDERFKERIKKQELNQKIIPIYNKILELDAGMGFLYNYCKAYSHLEGVEYFVPFTMQLRKILKKICLDMYEIIDHKTEDKEVEKRVKNFLDNIKPITEANCIYDEWEEDF